MLSKSEVLELAQKEARIRAAKGPRYEDCIGEAYVWAAMRASSGGSVSEVGSAAGNGALRGWLSEMGMKAGVDRVPLTTVAPLEGDTPVFSGSSPDPDEALRYEEELNRLCDRAGFAPCHPALRMHMRQRARSVCHELYGYDGCRAPRTNEERRVQTILRNAAREEGLAS